MKLFKKIWITLLFAGTLSSCGKDVPEIIAPEEEPGMGQGKFFSTTISIPVPARTQGTRSSDIYSGTNEESLIRGLRIVMYDAASDLVAYSMDIEAFNVLYCWDYDAEEYHLVPDTFYGNDVAESGWNDSDGDGSDDQIWFITRATEEIVRGNYKMLVLLNPTDQLKAITEEGMPLSDLEKPATGKGGGPVTPEDMTGGDFKPTDSYFDWQEYHGESRGVTFSNNNFVMLNSQGLVDVKPGDFYKTAEQAQIHPVYTGVERAVAKVKMEQLRMESLSSAATRAGTYFSFMIYRAPSYDYSNDPWGYYNSDYLDLLWESMTWGVDITNKKSYWMRKLANKAGNSVMEKRGDRDRDNFYAKDTNFSDFSGKEKDVRENEFNYISAADVNKRGIENLYYSSDSPDYPGPEQFYSYIFENTMEASEQRGDVSTRIVVRAVFEFLQLQYSQSNVAKRASSKVGDDLPTGSSFYVYKSGRADNPYNNSNDGDHSTFFIILPSDLQLWATNPEYLPDGNQTKAKDYYTGNDITIETGDAPKDFPLLGDAIQAVKDKFGGNFDFEHPSVESFVEGDLEYHKDGISWYNAPIRHFSDAQESNVMGYGRYGVVRNNIYKIAINYLNNAGSPVFPEPKPEQNDKIKNIDLNIWVNSWYERNLTYQFGSIPN